MSTGFTSSPPGHRKYFQSCAKSPGYRTPGSAVRAFTPHHAAAFFEINFYLSTQISP